MLALLAAALIAQDAPPPRAEPAEAAPRGKTLEWTTPQGRPYWYRLPAKMDPRTPPHLVLMLHGTGLDHRWSFWNYPIANGGFRKSDIVVSPDGLTPGQGDTFNFTQGRADADQIAGLIGLFRKRFPVANVYLYGHSQGAFFAYWFAGEHPQLVDGLVAHAGNVLADVRHPKHAIENLAVGILHGRADAVVPVACATETEKVYRAKGYRKLKLMIVEGLTEKSGHWPLPDEVAEMMRWLDGVSLRTARAAVDGAVAELARPTPDLATVIGALGRVRQLEKAARTEDRAHVQERDAGLLALLDEIAREHAAALPKEAPKEYGPWAAHFRAAERSLAGWPEWMSATKGLQKAARAHDRLASAASAALPGSAPEAVKAAEKACLATNYEELLDRLRAIKPAPPGLAPLVEARRATDEEGRKAAREIEADRVAAFRERHAAWFATE